MPELPDITVYIEHLQSRIVGQPLEKIAIAKPFVLRSFDPPVSEIEGTIVRGVRRMGKRIVLAMDGERFSVIHLMSAGRLRGSISTTFDATAMTESPGAFCLINAFARHTRPIVACG